MILSPLQETPRIGRTSVYYASFAAYLLLQAPILASGNLGCILFFRFVTGFVGSPAIATGVASLSDMWGVLDMPYAVGSWSVFAVAGPSEFPSPPPPSLAIPLSAPLYLFT